MILYRHIEKEDNYAVTKNVRFGKWKFVKDSSLPASILVSVTSQEIAISDTEAISTKKLVKRKKYLRVINVIKESVGATSITKHILDLRIYLTVDKLLTSVPAIKI